MPKRICAQCKAGDSEAAREEGIMPAEADCYVEGKIVNNSFSGHEFIPYRGYLCDDHLDMLLSDGAELKATKIWQFKEGKDEKK